MKILFVGHADPHRLTRYRASALTRLGHAVTLADPYAAFSLQVRHAVLGRLHLRSGYRLLQTSMCKWIAALVDAHRADPPDLVWVDHGELLGRKAASMLRQLERPVLIHNVDDPTGTRDGRRFDSLLEALPVYDLCAIVRMDNVSEFAGRGARAIYRTWMGYDEVEHLPFEDSSRIPDRFRSDVVFVGTWIRGEERDRFLIELIERGLEIAIWGDRWSRSPLWKKLRAHWRGPAVYGRDYVAAIQGAKLALGFLSHGNRDHHTARSMEIPYAGGLLCAERTWEHMELYREGVEAVFWSDPAECAATCHRLLGDDRLRDSIRVRGMARVRSNGLGNESICQGILDSLPGSKTGSTSVTLRSIHLSPEAAAGQLAQESAG